jgi:hypothetical protein
VAGERNFALPFASVHRVGCAATEASVPPSAVVVRDVRADAGSRAGEVRVRVQVDVLVLEAAPEALHEDVGVHRRLHLFAMVKRERCG